VAVLEDGADGIVRQPVIGTEILETYFIGATFLRKQESREQEYPEEFSHSVFFSLPQVSKKPFHISINPFPKSVQRMSKILQTAGNGEKTRPDWSNSVRFRSAFESRPAGNPIYLQR
jgi:hypothetical protein